ncbi:MAG: hypothetical protein ACD_45C00325G0006 [uncultured bacterium]|nr:MAG: hypothetical protein ACD_45C00325G0006 [uncultured bacterium]
MSSGRNDNNLSLRDLAKKITDSKEERIQLQTQDQTIAASGAEDFKHALQNAHMLKVLGISGDIGEQGMQVLSEVLPYTNIEELYLSDGPIDKTAGQAFAQAMQRKQLKQFTIDKGPLSQEAWIAILEGLKQENVLERLGFIEVDLGDTRAQELAGILKNKTHLKNLDLIACNIGPQGAVALANLLKTCVGLESFCINQNNIGVSGFKEFAKTLANNTTLKILNLLRNDCPKNATQEITDAFLSTFETNTTISLLLLPKEISCTVGSFLKRNREIKYHPEKLIKEQIKPLMTDDKEVDKKNDTQAKQENTEKILLGPLHASSYQKYAIEMIGAEVLENAYVFSSNVKRSINKAALYEIGVYFINLFSGYPAILPPNVSEYIKSVILVEVEKNTSGFELYLKDKFSKQILRVVSEERNYFLEQCDITQKKLTNTFSPLIAYSKEIKIFDYCKDCRIIACALKKIDPNLYNLPSSCDQPPSLEEAYRYGLIVMETLDKYKVLELLNIPLQEMLVNIENQKDPVIVKYRSLLLSHANHALKDISHMELLVFLNIFEKIQESAFKNTIDKQDCIHALRQHINNQDKKISLLFPSYSTEQLLDFLEKPKESELQFGKAC